MDRDIVTVPEVSAGAAVAPFKAAARARGAAPKEEGKNAITQFPVLQDVRGVFRPGEITLVLAPRATARRPPQGVGGVLPDGSIDGTAVTLRRRDGLGTPKRASASTASARTSSRWTRHLPFLTVKETAAFSHDNSCPPPPDTDPRRCIETSYAR